MEIGEAGGLVAGTVEFDVGAGEWRFAGKKRAVNRHTETLVIHRSDLDACTATDLRNAMRRAFDEYHGAESVEVTDHDEQYILEDYLPLDPVRFLLVEDDLRVTFIFVQEGQQDAEITPEEFSAALDPLLKKHRVVLDQLEQSDFYRGAWVWDVALGFNTRGRTLASLYEAGQDCLALMEAFNTGELTRESAAHLVRAGRADVLIGQPESHWLEAKSQHYDLSTAAGQISLAQAVSRFCNSEDGGLVVVGLKTKKTQEGERIRSLSPMPRDERILRKYQQALEKRLFPPPDNLQIEAIDHGSDSQIVLIDIPPQPEELKPFLVFGAIVDGREEGAFISIVRRRGETSIPVTAPMIHSTLAAGRALMRRGQLPS